MSQNYGREMGCHSGSYTAKGPSRRGCTRPWQQPGQPGPLRGSVEPPLDPGFDRERSVLRHSEREYQREPQLIQDRAQAVFRRGVQERPRVDAANLFLVGVRSGLPVVSAEWLLYFEDPIFQGHSLLLRRAGFPRLLSGNAP